MSMVLNLSPERERRLKSFAAKQGKPEAEIIEAWIDAVPIAEDRTEAVFAQWKADSDAMTEEERAEDDRKTDEVMAALRALDAEPEVSTGARV